MKKETIKTILLIVLTILVISIVIKTKTPEVTSQDTSQPIILTDTITNVVYDTVFLDHYKTVKLPVDTVTITNDSIRIDSVFVEVPISIYRIDTTFSTDSTVFNLSIRNSGYDVKLDSLSYSFTYKPTHQKTNFFRDHFRFGLGAGAGYGLFTKKPDVFLGFGFFYVF
jgi:hypothetical protein